ncbi:bifunctional glycosyltransferase family 2/GtrA family protein [Desulfovibrio inopinatus]|uniref:bifunctional glycosyltransferase family 2/GtrA family protein n=1 Tax=Desulfovibrio inopinatus TaxID=102109 RepID=UPI00041B520A|nr:bifunctional glycosyltransferase family 2/GtrA family protein [Desulfovibrio inopinatus]
MKKSPAPFNRPVVFSIVIPCFNEEATLRECVEAVLRIADDMLNLDIIIVDDASKDASLTIAQTLEEEFEAVRVVSHAKNQGKGAALRTGFALARGEFVAVQDADLEYNPCELRGLLAPLVDGRADVVFGSRYRGMSAHRVLYFWHSLMNRTLTLLSNMFTDLDLTDMETCYKVFRTDIIQSITIEENRFGFEPEIVAKVAQQRLRIYEMAISYSGRTYAEGKKINWKDGLRALYCIFHYSAHCAPVILQFLIYLFIGGISAIFNILFFLGLVGSIGVGTSAGIAYILAAVVNYWLCVKLLFRKGVRWSTWGEFGMYALVVAGSGFVDVASTTTLASMGVSVAVAKAIACVIALVANFLGRKYLVFFEPPPPPWTPS